MDEATKKIFFRRRRERGQAMVEYVILLVLVLTFTRFVFFNKNFGFQATLDKTMLRLGGFLEQNLKSGTGQGSATSDKSLVPYAGTNQWSN